MRELNSTLGLLGLNAEVWRDFTAKAIRRAVSSKEYRKKEENASANYSRTCSGSKQRKRRRNRRTQPNIKLLLEPAFGKRIAAVAEESNTNQQSN